MLHGNYDLSGGVNQMREYKIRYKCGTSPYWYIVSYYASDKAEALEMFNRYDCPPNVREIEVEEV